MMRVANTSIKAVDRIHDIILPLEAIELMIELETMDLNIYVHVETDHTDNL